MIGQVDEKLREYSSQLLYLLEAALYISVGVLLGGAAVSVLVRALATLWRGLVEHGLLGNGLEVLDQLLLVLVLLEILHTVRMSIRARDIIVEPFLIVGLIATVRRVLVITMQAAKIAEAGGASPDAGSAFQRSMIELGLMGILVLVFVFSIYFLKKTEPHTELVKE